MLSFKALTLQKMNRYFFLYLLLFCLFFPNCKDHKAIDLANFQQLQQSVYSSWPNNVNDPFFIPDKNSLAEQLSRALQWKSELQDISVAHLPLALQRKRDSLLQICDQTIEQLSVQQIHRWQASWYDVGPILQQLQTQEPELFNQAVKQVPAYYEVAKQNLDSTDLNQLNTAIRFNVATFRWLTELEKKSAQEPTIYQAKLAVKDFVAYCNSLVFEYYDGVAE